MNPLALFWNREAIIFHVRVGGCGGCGDVVDNWIRSSRNSRKRLVECSSPRHAELVIVSGCGPELLEEVVLSVTEQTPRECRVLLVGDCALGRGPFGADNGRVKQYGRDAGDVSIIEGCPADEDSIAEGVSRCLGWG